MRRRAFLKSIATVCGAVVVCPGELLKGEPMPKVGVGERSKHIVMGVTNKQLCELIEATLRDLPEKTFDIPYDIPYYFGVEQHYMSRPSGFIVMRPE